MIVGASQTPLIRGNNTVLSQHLSLKKSDRVIGTFSHP